MAPKFNIILYPKEPELEYLCCYDEHTWDCLPQPEYLGNLTQFQQELYEKLRAQDWTDEQCYFYFTNHDVIQGFRSEFLHQTGWTEENIDEWVRECQRTNIVPGPKEGTDSEQIKHAIIMDILKEGNRRQHLSRDMMRQTESQDNQESA